MASEFGLLRSHEVSSKVTCEALSMFQRLFCTQFGLAAELVMQPVRGLEGSAFIAETSVALSQDVLEATSQ